MLMLMCLPAAEGWLQHPPAGRAACWQLMAAAGSCQMPACFEALGLMTWAACTSASLTCLLAGGGDVLLAGSSHFNMHATGLTCLLAGGDVSLAGSSHLILHATGLRSTTCYKYFVR